MLAQKDAQGNVVNPTGFASWLADGQGQGVLGWFFLFAKANAKYTEKEMDTMAGVNPMEGRALSTATYAAERKRMMNELGSATTQEAKSEIARDIVMLDAARLKATSSQVEAKVLAKWVARAINEDVGYGGTKLNADFVTFRVLYNAILGKATPESLGPVITRGDAIDFKGIEISLAKLDPQLRAVWKAQSKELIASLNETFVRSKFEQYREARSQGRETGMTMLQVVSLWLNNIPALVKDWVNVKLEARENKRILTNAIEGRGINEILGENAPDVEAKVNRMSEILTSHEKTGEDRIKLTFDLKDSPVDMLSYSIAKAMKEKGVTDTSVKSIQSFVKDNFEFVKNIYAPHVIANELMGIFRKSGEILANEIAGAATEQKGKGFDIDVKVIGDKSRGEPLEGFVITGRDVTKFLNEFIDNVKAKEGNSLFIHAHLKDR